MEKLPIKTQKRAIKQETGMEVTQSSKSEKLHVNKMT